MNRNIVKVDGAYYQGSTNIRKLKSAFFSIKNRKFINPCKRYGDSVAGWWEYMLYEGKYILFNYYRWSKGDPAITFEICLINLKAENIEVEKSVKFKVDDNNEIIELLNRLGMVKMVGIVEDFLKVLPAYHIAPDIRGLAKKIYDEEAVNVLCDFLDKFNNEEIFSKIENE